ncbi:hypothetical protein JYK02_11370 [Corallococcus macrosporus]|uniref:Lipoprotein n=1 Tax=Corallococcus macrosporus TaxID=35 RepID=A0ABS3DBR8_9BACT|nr:hypothetical protein [Corallococcus macrosporus]MBN8228107.1 hypothetical protein [Corallococcus macrosporus]
MRFLPSAAFVFAASLATACGGPLEEAQVDDSSVADESIASQEQGMDESCVNPGVVLAQPDGAAVTAVHPSCGYLDAAAASNDSSYDQTDCPNRFVTEVSGLGGKFAQPFVEVIPASSNVGESACKGVAIIGSAFGYKNSLWYSMGSVTTTGNWIPPGVFFPNGLCILRVNIGSGGTGYSKIRVTGVGAALGAFKTRVRTGVRLGTSSC